MKTILLTLFIMNTSAFASVEFQMNNIIGTWKIFAWETYYNKILIIKKQTTGSIKVTECFERDFNRISKTCPNHSAISTFTYQDDIEAFFIPHSKPCSKSLQVTHSNTNELLITLNPYFQHERRCIRSSAGQNEEAIRLY